MSKSSLLFSLAPPVDFAHFSLAPPKDLARAAGDFPRAAGDLPRAVAGKREHSHIVSELETSCHVDPE